MSFIDAQREAYGVAPICAQVPNVPSTYHEHKFRQADLVQRQFTATRPNQMWVASLTYVSTWMRFVFVAHVIDVFSRMIAS